MTSAERNAVVEAHMGLVYFHLRGCLTHNRGWVDGDDLIQEGFLGLMHAIEKYDPTKGTLATYSRAWIRSAAQRALEDLEYPCHVPRKSWHPKPPAWATERGLDEVPAPDGGLDRSETLDAVWAVVGRLRRHPRIVLKLRYRDGLSRREVAARLGCGSRYVWTLERQALERLRRRMHAH